MFRKTLSTIWKFLLITVIVLVVLAACSGFLLGRVTAVTTYETTYSATSEYSILMDA